MKIDTTQKIISVVAGILTIFWVSYNIIKEFTPKLNAKLTSSKTDTGL